MLSLLSRKKERTARIGVFAVAHNTYFGQFEGLYENLMGYHKVFCDSVAKNQVEVLDFGMVDTSEKAYETAEKLQSANVDVIFCNMITYATSSVFSPIIREVNRPMILVALQPRAALDYTKANTFMQLENDNICSVPEFTGVAARLGRKIYDCIIGTLYDDAEANAEIKNGAILQRFCTTLEARGWA